MTKSRFVGLTAIITLALAAAACAPAAEDASETPVSAEGALSQSLYSARSSDVLDISLDGPLQDLFAHRVEQYASKNEESAPEPGSAPYVKAEVKGQLRTHAGTNEVALPVALTMHGSSSLGECSFPKVQVELLVPTTGADPRVGTPFQGTKKFVLRTHCGSSPVGAPLSEQGRLMNATSVRREAFAYKLADALGVPTHKVRLATVHYKDTGTHVQRAGVRRVNGADFEVANTTLTSEAFVLEDDAEMAKRLGGDYINVKKVLSSHAAWSDNPIKHIGVPALARVVLFEQAIGNPDWRFDTTGKLSFMEGGMQNLEVVRLSAGAELLVAYDFDVAKAVTGAPLAASLPLATELPQFITVDTDANGADLPLPIGAGDLAAAAKRLAASGASPLATAQAELAAFPFGSDTAGKAIFKKRLDALAAASH